AVAEPGRAPHPVPTSSGAPIEALDRAHRCHRPGRAPGPGWGRVPDGREDASRRRGPGQGGRARQRHRGRAGELQGQAAALPPAPPGGRRRPARRRRRRGGAGRDRGGGDRRRGAGRREAGTDEEPGTMLVTVSGAVARPGVVEVPLGVGLGEIIERAVAVGLPAAALVGGFFGTWVPSEGFWVSGSAWTTGATRSSAARP